METEDIILIVVGLVVIGVMTQRWFWLFVFGVGGLASAFACLASIVQFEILWALGFFFLAVILFISTFQLFLEKEQREDSNRVDSLHGSEPFD